MKTAHVLKTSIEAWLLWMIVTGISWFACFLIASIIVAGTGMVFSTMGNIVITSFLGGALLGLAQLLFLRLKTNRFGLWVLVSATGWVVGISVTVLVSATIQMPYSVLIGGALGGLLFGVAQYFILPSGLDGKTNWISMSIAGWIAALMLGVTLTNDQEPVTIAELYVDIANYWMLGGVLVGMLATIFLILLFPKSPEKDMRQQVKWW